MFFVFSHISFYCKLIYIKQYTQNLCTQLFYCTMQGYTHKKVDQNQTYFLSRKRNVNFDGLQTTIALKKKVFVQFSRVQQALEENQVNAYNTFLNLHKQPAQPKLTKKKISLGVCVNKVCIIAGFFWVEQVYLTAYIIHKALFLKS